MTSPSATEVQALFNRIAPVYDQLNTILSLGQHRIWKKMAVKWSQVEPGNIALDLCCGSGDLAEMLAQRVGPMGRVYGVDFSCNLLEVARERLAGSPVGQRIQWQQGDALALEFPDQYFDAATLGYGLRNVGNIPRCLSELHRVLKPQAYAAILDLHRPSSEVVRGFQQWYLDTVVVPAAARLGFTEEYAYLAPSLERFPTGPEQEALAKEAGFRRATHYTLAVGMMGCLVVQA
ncbi:bifunctional demethylmenaquinone methyltransferase/2-methoxy-6-polyprenyl-1,4-benzoquinol methylase UbiE [Leptolyngbya sp. FACHB-261]|uniref:bifunctional demethylmenaquinone methyltransferase/2-methoxy-6-polyprenyl-1,4-benzoquinol methylase UbiE n=1 Tax=Leptolyngbya sp. FACHB-261 TaxID=2692806 RepID=UPI001687E2F5|nr:bifunctional demethylmenaquinone methyltransferase/2-methoxy-6-polyprenyl-1,4-benzoquinol methylase UbiE [Leptolyngbya sp. FACHB-261]MBD2100593.1 bifunctional demethylmenaquinone methyltransferase/2-methoxy-6-polyprenyl-1,4-benzoquinol methylase UbiE [Leptolyngbya sp. FACHB-261]